MYSHLLHLKIENNKNIGFSNLLNSEQIHKNYLNKISQGTFWIFFKTSMCTLNVFFKHNKCPRFVITFSACNFEKCFINIINVKETFLHLLHEFLVGVSIVFQGLENYFTRITYGLFEGNFWNSFKTSVFIQHVSWAYQMSLICHHISCMKC